MRTGPALVVLTVLVTLLSPGQAQAAPKVIDGWTKAAPSAVGLKGGVLKRLAREARAQDSTCYAVIRKNRLAGEWNWDTSRTTPRQGFSITKSVVSALVGIAVRDGDLRLDDPVAKFVPAWRGTPSGGVTVRNLLSNDSGRYWSAQSDYGDMIRAADRTGYAVGLSQQYPVGSAWAYNNAAIQVLDAVLRKATGRRTSELARTRLFEPLGMSHTRMIGDSTRRNTMVFFGVQTTCLDLARFGRLYLNRGKVGRHRILDRSWVRASLTTSTEHNAAYGFLWWLNRPGTLRGPLDPVDTAGQPTTPVQGQLAPGAPTRVFAALGLGGQVLLVDPTSRTIVVRMGPGSLTNRNGYGFADAARVITEAVR